MFCSCADPVNIVKCLQGSYASADKVSCDPCPTGHYCPTDGLAAPIVCVNGTYQNDTGRESCVECPAGKSCLSVSDTPSDCPNGTYSPAGVRTCIVCPSGYRFEARIYMFGTFFIFKWNYFSVFVVYI